MKKLVILIMPFILFACAYEPPKKFKDEAVQIITSNFEGKGYALQIEFEKGRSHNYPLMAVWVEDIEGKYIQTLYVAQSVAKGFFAYGDKSKGKWQPGPIRRPASLPYWAHKRGIKEADGLYMPTQETPVPDAYTGATPVTNFTLKTKTDSKGLSQFKIMFEINQSWDWNSYWHNSKYPYDNDYQSSSQPALVYEVLVDVNENKQAYEMRLIGHSHWSGKTGALFADLSSITTAKDIVKRIIVRIE